VRNEPGWLSSEEKVRRSPRTILSASRSGQL
jgi:hypothetical protein